MKTTRSLFSVSAAASAVGAVQYSLNTAQLSANQPFSDAFVSYSIEFSSFPDFAGEYDSVQQTNDNDILSGASQGITLIPIPSRITC